MAESNKKILVTGANGQLGFELQYVQGSFPNSSFVFTDKEELDITDADAVAQFFEQGQFTHCINCAAYTAVDKAEEDKALCRLINTTAVEYLVRNCERFDVKCIHISTDYVYHNAQNTPFVETDITSPKGVYAATKLAGDQLVLSSHSESIVIRTSWVYSSHGHNFVKTMLRLGAERDRLGVIFDQIGSPTYARDLAEAILHIIHRDGQWVSGLYHYSNEGVCSWYDFARAIFELSGISCDVSPILTSDYPTAATRPPFSLLNKAKIRSTFELSVPYWRDSLIQCLNILHDQ